MPGRALDLTRRSVLGGLAAAPLLGSIAQAGKRDRPPNILLILADDMGFSDLGCYGGELPTPNLDALAQGGLRLQTFYSTGRCCPSRASLLTGRTAHAVDVGHLTRDLGVPGYRGALRPGVQTVADALRASGYDTHCIGKWHLNKGPGQRPLERGFDHFYGILDGGGVYYTVREDRALYRDQELIADHTRDLPKRWYSTDRFTDQAMAWMDESLDAERPFFTYLSHIAPHDPLQAPQAEIEALRGGWAQGWDQIRETRLAAAITQGVVPPGTVAAPRDADVPAWADLDAETRDLADHIMASYAAVVARMDLGVGRIVEHLAARDALHDTLILFLSDNGASAEGGRVSPPKGTGRWGGTWSQVRLGRAWANTANAPFRRFKMHVHEGGTRSPLIAHWPAGIDPALNGTVSPAIGHLIDLMPTLLDVAGASRSVMREAEGDLPLEGISLLPALEGQPRTKGRALFWEHEGHMAVRDGDLKLVSDSGDSGDSWALYDLAADPTELQDLAAERPEDVTRLVALWQGWAARAGVRPWAEVAGGGPVDDSG